MVNTLPFPVSWNSKDKDIYQLMQFQKNEQDISRDTYFKNFGLPVKNRVLKGIALTNLSFEELESSDNIRLIYKGENNSKFRVGDYIKIHCDEKYDLEDVLGIIVSEGDTFYDIQINSGSLEGYNEDTPFVMDYSFSDSAGDIIDRSLKSLETNEKKNLILNIIHGKALISKDRQEYKRLKELNIYDVVLKDGITTLEKSQIEGFLNSVTNSPLYLIQGPPGTGKTLLLAFLCNFLASEGKNILVTGFTHRSINNALKAIWDSSETKELIVKISDETKTTEFTDFYKDIPVYKRFDDCPLYFNVNKGLIVGATPYEVTRREFDDFDFDYVIFDEASQLHVNLGIMGMLRGNKYIFFGDHKQMKPIILGNKNIHLLYKKDIFNKSIFEFLYDAYSGTTLRVCYRMNPKLISFSSNHFYRGKVYTPPASKRKILKLSSNPKKQKEILNPRNVDVVVKVNHSMDEIKSISESVLIGEFVKELIRCGVSPNEIGIIAPYRPQLTLIKRELRKICAESENIIVETIERIQGQERDVIIFSLTRSNLDVSLEELEFFFTPNRLNVAITRAKCKRIVIGSEILFDKKKINKSLDKNIKCFTDFLNNADEIITITT